MDTLAWILQALLGVAFLGAGVMKLARPRAKVAPSMRWAGTVSDTQFKTIGAVETLGALGVLLPAVTESADPLAPFAALGLFLVMVGAVAKHVQIKDPAAQMVPAVVLGLIAVVVAILRFGPVPLA